MKEHLILDASFNLDDNYIIGLIDVAESCIENVLDNKLINIANDGVLPSPIQHAIKLLVANLYENREPLSSTQLYKNALSYEYLLSTYKNYSVK